MNIKLVPINSIKTNPNNPRIIKNDKFNKLVKSIAEFPKMLELRPIVVDADNVVLGGNMRLKACKEAGLKDIYIINANELTPEEQQQFIIKDNVSFGEWDWDKLANEWSTEDLKNWGLDVWEKSNVNLEDFFEENNEEKEIKNKIVLEYSADDFELVNNAFKKHSESKETIVFKLLELC